MTSADVAARSREGPDVRASRLALARLCELRKAAAHLFALPFALVGVVLASYRAPVTWTMVGWIVLAFTWRDSPRWASIASSIATSTRGIRGRGSVRFRAAHLRVTEAVAAVSIASLLFIYAAWRLNPLCAMLSPVALAWVFFYSYTKRFTRWCHLVLGIGMSIAPVGGYLAVTGKWSDP